MNRQHRPSSINLSSIPDMPEHGYDSSGSTMYLLTPGSNADTGSLSATPSPLSSPADPYLPDGTPSVFESQRYLPYAHPYYPSQPNLGRRASIAVEPSYHYSFPRNSSTPSSLTVAEQESLPSWRRDFDKLSDPTVKDRWSRELYDDFLAGRIPMTGRVAADIIDWETCVAKVDGVKDAEATAKMLVAAQERKAELQPAARKAMDKEPPRRQNKFICYRSLRSSQLASHFTNFKQSQFSAVTSLEWKVIDTDWWGEVANLVEEVRRAKYFGQLDNKGNPLRRGSVDSHFGDPFSTPKPRRPSKAGKSTSRRASVTRFDPYSTTPMRSTSRVYSSLASSPQPLLSPPVVGYRHSIDMGSMPPPLHSDSGLGLYSEEPMSFPTLTTIPQSPITINSSASTYAPAPARAPDHSYFSDPFPAPFSSRIPPATPISTVSLLQTPYQYPSYYPSSTTPTQAQPQVYVPQTWTPHGRGATNELMEMYTMAQDYTPATQQCWAGSEWTSHYPGMTTS